MSMLLYRSHRPATTAEKRQATAYFKRIKYKLPPTAHIAEVMYAEPKGPLQFTWFSVRKKGTEYIPGTGGLTAQDFNEVNR